MAELMKDQYYNAHSLGELARRFAAVYSAFPAEAFVRGVMDEGWEALELKARMRRITTQLASHLPSDYAQALAVIDRVVAGYPEDTGNFALMVFPDFVEVYGQDERHWELSMAALERYTPSSTSEFAVRPFILKQPARMMAQMAEWARHENPHVRRLASEGCRPALPWGQALPAFKKDPAPVLRILEALRADPSLYVRKSVANNLNDISKTHPELVTQIAKDWYGKNEYTDWIVKHGCRTLLKKGSRELLEVFGFASADMVDARDFALEAGSLRIGQALSFSFTIQAKKAARVRLEYGIDYVKANGSRSRKIFQISELSLKAGAAKPYGKTHSFANNSTRRHHPGTHALTLIVNGAERGTLDFELLEER